MESEFNGVCPDRMIHKFCDDGVVTAGRHIDSSQIQSASLDLRLGAKAYRVRASFLAGKQGKVRDRISEFCMHEISLSAGAVLEKGCVYIVQLMESLRLPENLDVVANAKSSTGRLDLLTRLIGDKSAEFDRVAGGYAGPIYAEICPRSFSVLVREGSRLNQIRFRKGQAVLSDADLSELNDEEKLVSGEAIIDNGMVFSVDLSHELVGYSARPHTGIIDVDKTALYEPEDYWIEVRAVDRKLILDPGSFYILASRESVSIPPGYAAEMVPYIPMIGEFRVHYAGFFDPGFGFSKIGGSGSRGVLEVRCHEAPFLLEHGQSMGKLVFERMIEMPEAPYGTLSGSHYQGQRLKLSKHFISRANDTA